MISHEGTGTPTDPYWKNSGVKTVVNAVDSVIPAVRSGVSRVAGAGSENERTVAGEDLGEDIGQELLCRNAERCASVDGELEPSARRVLDLLENDRIENLAQDAPGARVPLGVDGEVEESSRDASRSLDLRDDALFTEEVMLAE